LALAVLVFSNIGKEENKLFIGEKQQRRFGNCMKIIIKSLNESELISLGNIGNEKDYSTHSVRKGALTYCSSICGGPSWIQIFLRAGWSIGKVQDRYLQQQDGADQFVGRTLCGNNPIDIEFSTLPPHFNQNDTNKLESLWINAYGNKYNELTTGFKQTLPYLVASIVYHIDFFKKNLNENHPFFQSLLFTRNFIHENKLKEKIETGNFNNTKTNMRATGLPPYMLMAQEIVSLKDTVGSLQNKLQQSLSQLPTEVTNSILNKCQINGAIPIVASDFKAFEDRFEQRIRSQIDEIKQSVSVTAINNNLMDVVHPPNEPDFDWHYWKEAKEYHMIPENWTAPTGMYCKEMWFLWNHGNKEKRIAPLRRLKSSIIPVKKNKNNFIKIQGVMKELIKKSGLEPMDISDKTIAESGEIFDNSYQSLIKDLRPILSRRTTDRYTGKWKIATVYKHIRKLKRKQENKQYKPRKKRRTEENK
jgi:hypothetical protein